MSQYSLANAIWHKSSLSGNGGADCVEVATNFLGIATIRDSKDPLGPALAFSADEWRTFINSVKNGKFDNLK